MNNLQQLLSLIGKNEQRVDNIRAQLSNHPDFYPEELFNFIDKDSKRYIDQ